MQGAGARMLQRWGVDPVGFVALTRAFLLMDLRGQHYATATATKPHFILSPLFIVVGQCFTASAVGSALLFARVDVFFFAFVHLSLSLLILGTAIVVEFQEVALNPGDLEILGYRPIGPRTYAAARLANLLFYFVLLWGALNLFPLMMGAALRDAGPWYAPAYLMASLAGNLTLLAVLIVLLSSIESADNLQAVKQILSWTQIIAIMVLVYGGQMMLRDKMARIQLWGAFPPDWTRFVPSTWLARFVEDAATNPSGTTAWMFLLQLGIAALACVVAVLRLEGLYRRMQPVEQAAGVARPLPAGSLGSLRSPGARWLTRSAEERVGYWLAVTFLRRDPGLLMRCLFTFQLAGAAIVVGMLLGQFGNPCRESDPARTTLAILGVFLLPLGAPSLVFNLTYCRDSEGGWILRSGPVARPFDLAQGACKAIQLWLVTPCCLALGIGAGLVWGDGLAGALHAWLAWGLTWIAMVASLWLITPALPFSLPAPRGAGLVVPPLPMLGFSLTLGALGTLHGLYAGNSLYWVAVFVGVPVLGLFLHNRADARLAQIGGAT